MKRRDFVLRSMWLAVLFGASAGATVRGQEPSDGDSDGTPEEEPKAHAEGHGGTTENGDAGSSEGGASEASGASAGKVCQGDPEYLICLECETPAYQFEITDGKITAVVCGVCGNDNLEQFVCPEEAEEMG